jgi:restriction system protein
MYWLLSKKKQKEIRELMDNLVQSLSIVNHKPPHKDQVFPFQGRKAINHAKTVIELLTNEDSTICDPFSGSGSFLYAGLMLDRIVYGNEYEPYTYNTSSSPFSLPDEELLIEEFDNYYLKTKPHIDNLYRTQCTCGNILPLDSLFFDREPLTYTKIETHERLGREKQNITFRGKYKCTNCGATEKHFDDYDKGVLDEIDKKEENFPSYTFIENSRINLSKQYLDYSSLFPKRSRLVLTYLWQTLAESKISKESKFFIENTILSILPLSKFKDYRSKSQDLHCPPVKLRESNILNALIKQFNKRRTTFYGYEINNPSKLIYKCSDYRDFLRSIKKDSIDLIITDPPWNDGNAYFERAQLYHPWINYDLKKDTERLSKEVIVSDSPERLDKQSIEQWWNDMSDLFCESYRTLVDHSFLVLYFRPIPANKWIINFNKLKLISRIHGFEPLLTCDLSNPDPSMRIQQSSHYAFSSDLIISFLKLNSAERRNYFQDYDIDEIAFRVAVELQDELMDSFTHRQWNTAFAEKIKSIGILELLLPKNRDLLDITFNRTCEELHSKKYLPKASTPYSDEIFNTPYIERVSIYIPYVIEELLAKSDRFTFDQFLLKVAEFVENGTRSILKEILAEGENSIHSLLNLYAEPIEGGLYFTKRPLPEIPSSILNILELDPYEFEVFIARLLEKEGFKNVVVSGRSGDRGVDIRCNDDDNNLIIVQCKRYTKSNIGSTPIQRLHSFASTRGASRKICITTTDFTRDGSDEARIAEVELINRDKLEELVAKHKMFDN